jgi:hypothetical protein
LIYRVRLNPKAYNPLTKKITAEKIWEVEQMKTKDSDGVKWHCHDVQIGRSGRLVPIHELFVIPKPGEKPSELEFEGYVLRGYDGSICIQELKSRVVK